MTEQVAEPSREQEEAAEGQEVGVRDPRERALRETEILTDGRQGDSDNRHVEDDHQVAEADDKQCEPAGASRHGHPLPPSGRRSWVQGLSAEAKLIGRRR